MYFKTFKTNIVRIYNIDNCNHDLFYSNNSINDKFKVYLYNKYSDKVNSYIKPFGFFSNKKDDITSINFRIGIYSNIFNKCKNKVSIIFEKYDNDKYMLTSNFYGIKNKNSYQILEDVINFMDNKFNF